jgi:membrane protease YdiL (CAAX protease family)
MARVRVPWWGYAFVGLVLVLGLGAAAVHARSFAPDGVSSYTGAPDLGLALTFVLVLVVNGYGEESGWRGYLVDRLVDRHGLVRTASFVALVWAGWHLPLFWTVDSFRTMGVTAVGWVVGLYAGSLALAWLYAAGGRSIFLLALWHTSYNFTSATAATSGLPAALTSTLVMVVAVLVVAVPRLRRAAEADERPLDERVPAATD